MATMCLLVTVLLQRTHVYGQAVAINQQTNEWTDDYECGSSTDLWNECSLHYISNNSYHGIYSGSDTDLSSSDSFTLTRAFECAQAASFHVQFWVGFACDLDGSATDGIDFYFNDVTPMAGCCDFSLATDGTLADQSLPNYQGQCNSNQPWILQHSPLYVKEVDANEQITLNWEITTSHIDHEIILYGIEITCSIDITPEPTMFPSTDPTVNPTTDPTRSPTTDPTIDPTIDPTHDPTYDPTTDPTVDPTLDPTMDPTFDPTMDPTYDPIGIITTEWSTLRDSRFIHDAYSRFQIAIAMKLELLKSLNKVRWFYIDVNAHVAGTNWTEITPEEYKFVNVYTSQITDEYKLEELGYNATDLVYSSVLTIHALRVLNSGYCYNTSLAPNHLLQPGIQYAFKLRIIADSIKNDRYDEYFDSDELHVTTNQFATNGTCIMRLLDPKETGKARLLDKFYFHCSGWLDPDSIDMNFTLKFNGLMNDVLIDNALLSELWTSNPSEIIGMIGTKALQIKTLIRDDLGAITCYDINVDESFPDAELTDEEILAAVKRVIRENSLGRENAIAVALDTILEGLMYIGYANDEVLQEIMDLIVVNVVGTSYATNLTHTSSSRVISESTMVRGLLSEDSLIFAGSASLLVDQYLPSLFNAIDAEIIEQPAIALDNSIGDSLGVIGVKGLDLSGKLETFMTADMTQFNDVNHNKILESFVEFDAYSGHVALAQSYPGEIFEYEDVDGQRTITTSKIDPNSTNEGEYQTCGSAQNSIMIPNTVTDTFYDCSFVDQKSVPFEAGNKPKSAIKDALRTLSNTVTINLYNGDIPDSFFDTRQKRRRRRRLGSGSDILDLTASHLESTVVIDTCNPYWINIDLSQNTKGLYADGGQQNKYSLNGDTSYPSCTFWNVTDKEWDTNNCFVYNYSSENVLCACKHLTTFNIKADDFQPKANMITIYHFRDLNKENLMKYPVVWISLIAITVIFIFICLLFPAQHKDNQSPLAYQDIIFRPVRDIKTRYFLPSRATNVFNDLYDDKHHEYGQGLIKSIRSNICILQLRLYKIYLYDMHTLLSVFQHSEGTNYSKRERLGSFFLYLCTIMVSSAAFYGVEQQRFGDITASFLISLWSTIPAFITKKSFIKAKPSISPFKINILGVDYDKIKKQEVDLTQLPLRENDVDRYDDDRFSLKISGFKRPILKETVEKEVAEFGEYSAFRMANTRTNCYVIFEQEASVKKCKKKLHGIKYPKNVKSHQTGTLSVENVSKLEAMAFVHGINEEELRAQWMEEHEEEVTQEDIARYKEIWPSIEAADGDFIGVDKYMVKEMVRIVFKAKDKTFHIAFLDYLRAKLLTKDQKWPHSMKYFGWIFLIVWCAGCCVLAIVYGISFDVQYEVEESETYSKQGYDDDCWTMNPQLVIQDLLTKDWIDDSINGLNNNFGANIGDSSSWLLQLLQSTLISIFLWQPLTIYFISWLMIWLFSWNLPVLLKPKNLLMLVKKICGIVAKNAEKEELKKEAKSRQKVNQLEVQMAEALKMDKKKKKKKKENLKIATFDRYSLVESRSTSAASTAAPLTPSTPGNRSRSELLRKRKPPTISLPKDFNKNIQKEPITPQEPKTKKQNKKKRAQSVITPGNDQNKLKKDTSEKKKRNDTNKLNKGTSAEKNMRKRSRSPMRKQSTKQNKKKRAQSVTTPRNDKNKLNKQKKDKSAATKPMRSINETKNAPDTPTTPGTPRSIRGKAGKTIRISVISPTTPKGGKAKTPISIINEETSTKHERRNRSKTMGDKPSSEITDAVQFKKGGTNIVEKVDENIAAVVSKESGDTESVFVVAVHHNIQNSRAEEGKYDDPFDIEYGTNRYQKIVSKEQRPFDVFSFFGGEIFFLDVVKSEDGKSLDIKGYSKEYVGDKEIVIEEVEKKAHAWGSAVHWH